MKKLLTIYFISTSFLFILHGAETVRINASKMNTSPKIDGKIEKDEWTDATQTDNFNLFISQRPENKHPSRRTVLMLGYDDDNLYIAFKCFKDNIGDIKADEKKRDSEVYQDDSVEIFLNTASPESNYYQFAVNSIGTQSDSFVKGSAAKVEEWDNDDWKAASFIGKDFWSAEIMIPFRILKIENTENWRINFTRNDILPLEEHITWAPIKSISGWHRPEQFGYLPVPDIPDYKQLSIVNIDPGAMIIGENIFSVTLKNNSAGTQNIRADLKIKKASSPVCDSTETLPIKTASIETIKIPYTIPAEDEYSYELILSYADSGKVFHTFSGRTMRITSFSIVSAPVFYSGELIKADCRINVSPGLLKELSLQINISGQDGKVRKEQQIDALSDMKQIFLPALAPGIYEVTYELLGKDKKIISSVKKRLFIIENYMARN